MKESGYPYLLTSQYCNAQGELGIHTLIGWMVDVACKDADAHNLGFTRLREDNNAWVMARLGLEVKRMPREGENLLFSTWIEKNNYAFSTRCFKLSSLPSKGGEEVCALIKTYWAIINLGTRVSQSLSLYKELKEFEKGEVIPIPSPRKILSIEGNVSEEYRVRVSDLDVNRHVNTARYVEHALNLFPLEWYDRKRVQRLDMQFLHEAAFGDLLQFVQKDLSEEGKIVEIRKNGIGCINRIQLFFAEREKK